MIVNAGLLLVNSLAAAVLLLAGLAKLVSPEHLRRALVELGARSALGTGGAVRAVALAECAAAGVLAVRPAWWLGSVLVGALGLSFALLGLVGAVRGSQEPCGCFGRPAGRPLGRVSVLTGFGLLATVAVNVWSGATPYEPAAGPLGAALALLVLCLVTNRSWVVPLVRPLLTSRARTNP
ncbi:MauE/DoxX family redox-associated membrane protein [Micromonospora sp. NPDC049559]|uniref:MauE/DoxX family redox-associated membrane protein n=1 Tax=Micromonospora sp. NPDC049559 TaxID=3155923 RepID=UPI003423A9D4